MNKFIKQIKNLKPTDAGSINTIIIEALAKLESDEDKKEFARAVKVHMGDMFKKSKAEARLKGFID